MTMRKGLGKGRGSGYYNILKAHDHKVHHDAGLGRKQPQRMPQMMGGGKIKWGQRLGLFMDKKGNHVRVTMPISVLTQDEVDDWIDGVEKKNGLEYLDMEKGFASTRGGKCGGKSYPVGIVKEGNRFYILDYDEREDRLSTEPIESFTSRKDAIEYAKKHNFRISGGLCGGKSDGKRHNVYLEDDGSLDTVVSVDGHTIRFDTEYAAQFRNKNGEITKAGWKRLKKEAIDAYYEETLNDETMKELTGETDEEYARRTESKGGKCGGKFVGKLPNVPDKIDTAVGEAKYIGTEVENEHGKWDDTYAIRDGYYVIHKGDKHHIYEAKGGKCSPSELKFGTAPDSQFDASQLKQGIKVETEHTSSRKVAKAIAKAHLKEMPDYYTKLRKMERGGKNRANTYYVIGMDGAKRYFQTKKQADTFRKKVYDRTAAWLVLYKTRFLKEVKGTNTDGTSNYMYVNR